MSLGYRRNGAANGIARLQPPNRLVGYRGWHPVDRCAAGVEREKDMMPESQQVRDDRDSEELIQHILRAGTVAVWDIVGKLAPSERVDLAALCWRRAHFHELGLAIAALCDKETMMHRLGIVVGSILYEQSREKSSSGGRKFSARKVTLANGRAEVAS